MYARTAIRSSRALRNTAPLRRNARFASDSATSQAASTAQNPALVGAAAGLAGGAVGFYLLYQMSGAATAARTASQVKSYVDGAGNSLKATFKENTPEPNEALEFLRETANKYARWLPGGREYVDKVFQDIDIIRKRHGQEVDKIVSDAYGELRDASKSGMSLQTMSSTWDVLSKHLQRLMALAGDAAQDILNNHPQLKEKLGGSFDNLKQMGDELGPEAKKQVDQTWQEVNKIVKEGIDFSTVDRVYKLVQEKQDQIKKMGKQAFDKGYEQLKPQLDKNPQVKELVEQNKDVLSSGSFAQLSSAVTAALSSGSTLDLEKYIVNAKEKAQSQFSSGNISQLMNMIPNGGKILPQLQKLQQAAQQHGQEAEQIAKDTLSEIGQVLDRRSKQLQDVYEKGKKDADAK